MDAPIGLSAFGKRVGGVRENRVCKRMFQQHIVPHKKLAAASFCKSVILSCLSHRAYSREQALTHSQLIFYPRFIVRIYKLCTDSAIRKRFLSYFGTNTSILPSTY